jgi:hypothetical protein
MKDAVRDMLAKFVARVKESSAIATEYQQNDFHTSSSRFVQLLNETKSEKGLVDRKAIPRIFRQLNDERTPDFYAFPDEKLKHVVKTFNTDERMKLWLKRCEEPMISGGPEDDVNIMGIEELMACGDVDSLLDKAIELEREHCSWATILGPALKAIRRLGRTSAGQDDQKLATYAKEHQKPAF